MAPLYYKEADVILLCVDPNDRRGLEFCDMWYDRISRDLKNVLWVVAQLKCDTSMETHKLKPAQIEKFVIDCQIPVHLITSAKENINVEKVFMQIAEMVSLAHDPPRKKR